MTRLRITSARAPYRRAGLIFTGRAPVEVELAELDADRLRALLSDPVLTVSAIGEDGTVRKLPALSEQLTEEDQRLLMAGIELAEKERALHPMITVQGSEPDARIYRFQHNGVDYTLEQLELALPKLINLRGILDVAEGEDIEAVAAFRMANLASAQAMLEMDGEHVQTVIERQAEAIRDLQARLAEAKSAVPASDEPTSVPKQDSSGMTTSKAKAAKRAAD